MEHFNKQLFLAINAGASPPAFVLASARVLADWLVPAAVLLFIVLWVRRSVSERGALLTTTLMALSALGINQALGLLYFSPRPFMVGLGHQYLSHAPDNSFPSDHATFLWTLGFTLLALARLRGWGILLVLAGVAVSWARIYVGVHFPLDMLGSLAVSICIASLARSASKPVLAWLFPRCNALYVRLIDVLRLPRTIFPR